MSPRAPRTVVRCAIYTRKSTEEGLQQEFNSLDAQRDAAEAYIRSQAPEGWKCLPTRYDDGGFSGGHLDRPALQRLLVDIAAGQVDVLVIYKIDRLSRSLLDFARLIDQFERHGVAFVAVTQQLNSATSMGRLVLNVLLSFAQFERELIAERTRDKIAATRRKGKWAGGMPVLGYDLVHSKLVVQPAEAERVRAIFQLYREQGALLPVVQELTRRDWRTKHWTTRAGQERGGRPFTTTSLHRLLTRVTYIGRVRYREEHHPGEHAAVIDAELWQQVQTLLRQHGPGDRPRAPSQDLLRGLLRCGPCGCAMTPSYAVKGPRRYRYYVCTLAQKRGRATCPTKSVPASLLEGVVWEQLRSLAQDPQRLRALAQGLPPADPEAAAGAAPPLGPVLAAGTAASLAEQAAVLQTLVRQIVYDGGTGTLDITFQAGGLRAWATEVSA